MGEICLSVAQTLRCQTLTRLEAGILLLPPGLEIVFACVLLWIKRASADKKHVFLASEIFVYFLLALLDVLIHTLPTIGSSLDSFKSLDIVIGAGSFISLFLYTFFLYLLTSTELVPSLPVRFQRIAKYILLAFIPLILLLNELASFLGITYQGFGGQDGTPLVGFTDPTPQMFMSTVTLVLLTAFQAFSFCIAFYRLVKALSHQRTIESTDREKKEMEAHLFRGLGWIVAGMKLGAIETVIGFAQGGFGVAFTRRLLMLFARACLVIGVVKGVDTVEDFQLYSPSEAQRRRKSMLRAMIQNPRFSTFRHVGGHDFDADNALGPKRESVIKLGDPSWMRRDHNKTALNEKIDDGHAGPSRKSRSWTPRFSRPSFRTSSRKSKGSSVRDSTSSFGSSRRTSWPPARDAIEEDEADYRDEAGDVVASEISAIPRPRAAYPRPVQERVTVYMRPDRLPVLQLRRLSNLDFLDLVTDPFRDPHMRARSLPGNFDDIGPQALGPASASLTQLPPYGGAREPVPPMPVVEAHPASVRSRAASIPVSARPSSVARPPSVVTYRPRDSGVSFQSRNSMAGNRPRDSVTTYNPRGSVATYNPRDSALASSRPSSTMSFHAIGTPSMATTFDAPQSALSPRPFGQLSRRDRGVSSSTTASEVQAIASQFPGIPARPVSASRPRSMLSREVPRGEFIVEEDEPMPADAAQVSRAPSVERAPASVPEDVSAPNTAAFYDTVDRAEFKYVQDRVISEQDATRSLPTPISPPHVAGQWPVKRARTLSGKRRPPPLAIAALEPDPGVQAIGDDADFVGSASDARRGAMHSQLMRVKSVGSAPQRSVSASQRTAFARGSIQGVVGHIAPKNRRVAAPANGFEQDGRLMEAVDAVRWSVFNEV